MTNEDNNSKDKQKLQYFLEEIKIAAEERWSFNDYTWNVFKFYITLLTGAIGVIALIYANQIANNKFYPIIPIIPIFSLIIFFIGLIVYLHILRLGKDQTKVVIRLEDAREEINDIIDIKDYLNSVKKYDDELSVPNIFIKKEGNIYSFKNIWKSVIRGGGIKVSLVLINSIVSIIGCISLIFLYDVPCKLIFIILIILIFLIVGVFSIYFHIRLAIYIGSRK